MNEIDVSKCEYYSNNYCSCYRDSYGDCYHKCTDKELNNCYYKQLQQAIKDKDYYKQIVDGCKSENGNCSFCEIDKQFQQTKEDIIQYSNWLDEAREDVEKAKKYNYDAGQQLIRMSQDLQQLKAENDELQEMNRNLSEKFANVCGGCFEQELREKYKQCLDECLSLIEKEVNPYDTLLIIKNNIKEVLNYE